MKDLIKLLVFAEVLALFMGGIIHLITFIMGDHYPLMMYLWMAVIVAVCVIFTTYIAAPLVNWWFDD